MTYFTQTAPSSVWGSIRTVLASVGTVLSGIYDSMARAAVANATAQDRIETVARQQAKSDEELAQMGLKREDIVHHVFRDLFWQ